MFTTGWNTGRHSKPSIQGAHRKPSKVQRFIRETAFILASLVSVRLAYSLPLD